MVLTINETNNGTVTLRFNPDNTLVLYGDTEQDSISIKVGKDDYTCYFATSGAKNRILKELNEQVKEFYNNNFYKDKKFI